MIPSISDRTTMVLLPSVTSLWPATLNNSQLCSCQRQASSTVRSTTMYISIMHQSYTARDIADPVINFADTIPSRFDGHWQIRASLVGIGRAGTWKTDPRWLTDSELGFELSERVYRKKTT
ncbi:hypothetical protein AB1N83_004213 [Pleurotus pulmonarius]